MGWLEELHDVWVSLNSQRFRAFLTLLGIILGVGTMVFLSSLLAGSRVFMAIANQDASGENLVTVSGRDTDATSGRRGPPLDRFDAAAIATAPRLEGVQVLNRYTKRVRFGSRFGNFIHVLGTTPQALDVYGISVAKGRFIAAGDNWNRAPVTVLGVEAVKKLLPDEPNPLGKYVKLMGKRYHVIGLLAKKARMSKGDRWTWDGAAVVPETTFVDRFAKSREIREVVIKGPPLMAVGGSLEGLTTVVAAILRGRHDGVANFEVEDPHKASGGDKLIRVIAGFLQVAIAGVCLGVGGINIMNIMVVSVTQRKREIGIRRALGATSGSIQRKFLFEAVLLSSLGGLLGILGGNLVAWLVALGLTGLWGHWPFVPMPVTMGLGFAAAVLTGMVFGWYPARRAARLAPVECLGAE